jgi:hypothetical protein
MATYNVNTLSSLGPANMGNRGGYPGNSIAARGKIKASKALTGMSRVPLEVCCS